MGAGLFGVTGMAVQPLVEVATTSETESVRNCQMRMRIVWVMLFKRGIVMNLIVLVSLIQCCFSVSLSENTFKRKTIRCLVVQVSKFLALIIFWCVKPFFTRGPVMSWIVLISKKNSVMPRLQAVVRPLAGNFWAKIADFASQTQDNRTIVARFFVKPKSSLRD